MAKRLPERRNRLKPGTWRRVSSTVGAAVAAISSDDRTTTLAGVSPSRRSVRVAVTGGTVSPPIFETLEVLGRERSLARLDAALASLHPSSEEELREIEGIGPIKLERYGREILKILEQF